VDALASLELPEKLARARVEGVNMGCFGFQAQTSRPAAGSTAFTSGKSQGTSAKVKILLTYLQYGRVAMTE
jgi:hypothetical protein